MQVNPDAEIFGDIKPMDEILENYDFAAGKPVDEVLVTGEKEQLEKLQESLRKAGYRQVFNSGPLKP